MSRPHVLRIPRSDEDEGSFVLVHVQPSSSKKARPLDVRIVATEGTSPYVVTCKSINSRFIFNCNLKFHLNLNLQSNTPRKTPGEPGSLGKTLVTISHAFRKTLPMSCFLPPPHKLKSGTNSMTKQ